MKPHILFLLLITTLVVTGCSRDISKQISIETAQDIAFKEVYSGTNITFKEVWHSTEESLNKDYVVAFKDINNSKCIYSVNIKYDGSKILSNRHSCYD